MFSAGYGGAGPASAQDANAVLVRRVASLVPDRIEAATLACRCFVQGMAMLALNDRLGSADPATIPAAMDLFVSAFGTRARPGDSARPKSAEI